MIVRGVGVGAGVCCTVVVVGTAGTTRTPGELLQVYCFLAIIDMISFRSSRDPR